MSCISTIETGEKNEISSMHYLTNANLVATGHDNGEIRLWNIEIGSFLIIDQTKTKSKHTNTVCALTSCTFESEEYMFSSGYDGRINVWEIFERK
jgi:WD40 repeat protein